MPHFNPSHMTGRTLRHATVHSGFAAMKEKHEEDKKDIEGMGLEQMADKLDKLIVKPRRKFKNIQFNP
jgi:uncharacterized protein YndB with AHSA1/START domain